MSYTAEDTARLNARADAISALSVGDGLTVSLWTDAHAYTIIKKTATTMTLRRDKATLDPSFKPEIIPGGFSGHCANQQDQTYSYESDPQGEVIKVSLRVWSDTEGNERRLWKKAGVGIREQGGNVSVGRREFHDYNF